MKKLNPYLRLKSEGCGTGRGSRFSTVHKHRRVKLAPMETPNCHTLHIYTVEYLKLQSSTNRCRGLYEFRDFVLHKYLDWIYLLSPTSHIF